MSVLSLLILNSSYVGSRDLWWVDDPLSKKGYNVYRAFDHPSNWVKINKYPISGHFYRDASTLQEVTYTVRPQDWVDRGQLGKWGFRIPDVPYSAVQKGRPVAATSPNDVTVILDGTLVRPVMVQGTDQTVWLRADNTLPLDGAVSDEAQFNTGNVNVVDYNAVQSVKVVYNKLINFVDIYTNLVRTFYTVVSLDAQGNEIKEPPPGFDEQTVINAGSLLNKPVALPWGSPIVDTQQVDLMDYMQKEMVRRNAWLFDFNGEPAYVMFRKTRGEVCGCKSTGLTQARTGCPICFEVGIVGGYFGPYDFPYIDPDTAATRELDEGGITVTRTAKSYLGPTPIVQDGDLIIRRNGERLIISGVTYKSPRGVILQQEFDVTLLNHGDTRYLVPVNTGMPTIFNPVVSLDPLDGQGNGEPMQDARTQPRPPEGQWENPDPQAGRTISFGKIMT